MRPSKIAMPETPDDSTDRVRDPAQGENGAEDVGGVIARHDDEDELADDGDGAEGWGDGQGEAVDEDEDAATRRAPWHFKVMLAATVIYLGYRSYQGITWLIHHA